MSYKILIEKSRELNVTIQQAMDVIGAMGGVITTLKNENKIDADNALALNRFLVHAENGLDGGAYAFERIIELTEDLCSATQI